MEYLFHILLILVMFPKADFPDQRVFRFKTMESCEQIGKEMVDNTKEVYAFACVDLNKIVSELRLGKK